MLEPKTPEPVDMKALWRNQPDANVPVPSPEVLTQRSRRLHALTRSEILATVGATLFLAIVLVSRFGLTQMMTAGLTLIAVWGMVTLYFLRRRVWPLRSDALAVAGAQFYRSELEQRRRHLRNAWLWHGPLLLACLALVGVAIGTGALASRRLPQVLPVLIALLAWTGFSIRQRLLEARAIQHELDELAD